MSIAGKIKTALSLAVRADWSTLRKRWFIGQAMRQAARHGGRAFVHDQMGFRAVCHPEWIESLDQYCNLLGYTRTAGDAWEFDLVRSWLRSGDAVIDAGTNLGLYTFAAADRIGPPGLVLSVDADPEIVNRLRHASSLLPGVHIEPLHGAVSDRTGSLTFYLRTDRTTTADQSLIPDENLAAACTPISIPAYTFADLLGRVGTDRPLALIKMDIEGAEAMALRTVPPALLGPDGPLWLVELNPGVLARFGADSRTVIDFFKRESFELWLVPKHPLGDPAQARGIRLLSGSDPLTDSLYYNLIAVPGGSRWSDRRNAISSFRPAE